MEISSLPQLVRNTKRFHEVVTTLAMYGLAPWMRNIKVDWIVRSFKDADGKDLSELPDEQRARLALTDLGTTFIKLGQILSTRPDLVGPELTAELAQLQSNAPEDPPDEVRSVIESELGGPPEALFAKFDSRALASASIGQVHLATLKTGEAIVVKVQHPGIEGKIRSDLEIMKRLAEVAEKYAPELRQYRPVETTAEFSRTLLAELDFTRELRNLDKFRRNFASSDDVHVPQPYADLSSRRVLTMDCLEGISMSDKAALQQAGNDLCEVARRGAEMFLDMIFRDGFYHADPHPGNLLVMSDGAIGVLDCGMVGRIDERLREQIEDLLVAAVNQDGTRLCEIIVQLGAVPPAFDENLLRSEIEEFVADFGSGSIRDFDLSGALNRMTAIIRDHGIILPSKISLLLKVLVMLEGTSRGLNPDFSLAELLEPYQVQIVQRRLSPKRIFKRVQRVQQDWHRLFETVPRDASEILRQIKRGRFDVHLEHRRLESTVNRLVMGLLTAALFVGSAMLWSRSVLPVVFSVSVPGAAGCTLSLVLGFRLLRAIKRSGDIEPK